MKLIPLLLMWMLVGGPTVAYGESLKCPIGATVKGERTPEGSEAWYEAVYEGKAVLHGPYRAWWPNGQLGTDGQYQYGKPVGVWKGWYADGKRQGEEGFADGRRVRGRYWNENGKPVANPPQQPNHSMQPAR